MPPTKRERHEEQRSSRATEEIQATKAVLATRRFSEGHNTDGGTADGIISGHHVGCREKSGAYVTMKDTHQQFQNIRQQELCRGLVGRQKSRPTSLLAASSR